VNRAHQVVSGTALTVGLILLFTSGKASLGSAVQMLTSLAFFAMAAFALELPRGGRIRLYGGVAVAAVGLLAPVEALSAMLIGLGSAGLVRPFSDAGIARILLEDLIRITTLLLLCVGNQALLSDVLTDNGVWPTAILVASGAVFMVVDLAAFGIVRGGKDVASGLSTTGGLFRVLGAGYLAQVCIGVVLVLVYPRMDFFAFLVLVPLMIIMQHTTGLLLSVRAAYMRTVGILAEVAELQTEGQRGHSQRVSRLATRIGRSAGLGSRQVERLALASLLHDIGRLRASASADMAVVADAGATVLSRVSFLASLSPIIKKQSVAYWQVLDPSEVDGRLARVIRLASDVDAMRNQSQPMSVADVVECVSSNAGRLYDPLAVDAFRRVWEEMEG